MSFSGSEFLPVFAACGNARRMLCWEVFTRVFLPWAYYSMMILSFGIVCDHLPLTGPTHSLLGACIASVNAVSPVTFARGHHRPPLITQFLSTVAWHGRHCASSFVVMFQHTPGLRRRMCGLTKIHYGVTELPKRCPLQGYCKEIGQHPPVGQYLTRISLAAILSVVVTKKYRMLI
jgi:hypothetical protein